MLFCQAAGWNLGSRGIWVRRGGSYTAQRIPDECDTVVRMKSVGKGLDGCLYVCAEVRASKGGGGRALPLSAPPGLMWTHCQAQPS